ncbi:MAG: TOBE domain-containing protein [Clostridiales bacterium]|nr:TOBE domain-containing protein [Clostridiales bacterium]
MFVAGFIGSPQMNFVDAMLGKDEDGYYALIDETRFTLLEERVQGNNLDDYIVRTVVIGIRPEDVLKVNKKMSTATIPLETSSNRNVLDTNVEVYEHMGAEIYVYIDYNGHKFTARFKSEDVTSEDEKLTITFKPEKIHVFDKETEVSLLGLDTKFNFNT